MKFYLLIVGAFSLMGVALGFMLAGSLLAALPPLFLAIPLVVIAGEMC